MIHMNYLIKTLVGAGPWIEILLNSILLDVEGYKYHSGSVFSLSHK